MYKKMLLAGAAGTLALSAIAAPAMATPKLTHKQAVKAASGEYKFCVKSHNLKSFPLSTRTCAARFGKGWKEISAASLGVAGAAGIGATSSPILSFGAAPAPDAAPLPTWFTTPSPAQLYQNLLGGASAKFVPGVYQIRINNYDPALTYETKASIGTLGVVSACTTDASAASVNLYYAPANVGMGCLWLTSAGSVNQSSIVSVKAKAAGLNPSTAQEIKVSFPTSG